MHIFKKLYFEAAKIKKNVFQKCGNISCISWVNLESSAFSIGFLEPTLEFQKPVTFLFVALNTKCRYSFS